MTRPHHFEPLSSTDFDVTIVGTGLSESILAAALSLSGSRVLHLDPNSFYGSNWSTFSLAALTNILETATPPPFAFPLHDLPIPPHTSSPTDQPVILTDLPQHARLFPHGFNLLVSTVHPSLLQHMSNIHLDLTPRPTMAASPLIDLLTRTNIGHYVDFRPLSALYLDFSSPTSAPAPCRVPATRADIFQHRQVTPIEKRLLARFVKSCLPDDPITTPHATPSPHPPPSESSGGTFDDAMTRARLTPTLKRFLTDAVLFRDASIPHSEGRTAIQRFHTSIRRFATPTPFLYPNHGGGELPQAFCRLSAVHGGTYVLRRGIAALLPDGQLITTEGDTVHSQHVFLSRDMLPVRSDDVAVWRFVGVLDASILATDAQPRCMVVVPDADGSPVVWMRQLDAAVMVCPPGFFVLYAETIGEGSEDVLLDTVRRYVNMRDGDEVREEGEDVEGADGAFHQVEDDGMQENARAERRPLLLWGMTYARGEAKVSVVEREKIVTMCPPERGYDADGVLTEAERCFRMVCPDAEFFPDRRTDVDGDVVGENGYDAEQANEDGNGEE